MKCFSIPSDFKKETIDIYYQMNEEYQNNKILETYGQLSSSENTIGSGRAADHIPLVTKRELEDFIKYSLSKDIQFNYTLNTTCLGNMEFDEKGMYRIIRFLEELYELGVSILTIALPSLIEIAKMSKYNFTIKASTVCNIINADKASSYKNLGVDRIVVDESINRDFDALKRIRDTFGEKVELIVNVVCYKNCIYRMFHHNQMSHDMYTEKKSVTYYSHRCMQKRCETPSNLLRMNFIRPEDLTYYSDIGINYFKLQGRQAALKGDIVKCVKAYITENYEGNLLDLLDCFLPTNSFKAYIDNKELDDFIVPFVKHGSFCKNNCSSCRYCDNYAKEHFDIEKIEKLNSTAKLFYEHYEQYTSKIIKMTHMGNAKDTDD
ncbi:MAG: U32 family peptidase [Bacillota bacterium]